MTLVVEKIANGTVIDHIRAGKGIRVLHVLGIDEKYTGRVALVMNAASKKLGKKDIVKIADRYLDEKTLSRIALLAPDATVNIIRNSEIAEKKKVRLPVILSGVIPCPNPKCITKTESVETRFNLEEGNLRCSFCEKVFSPEELV